MYIPVINQRKVYYLTYYFQVGFIFGIQGARVLKFQKSFKVKNHIKENTQVAS